MDDSSTRLPGFSVRGFGAEGKPEQARYWHFKHQDTKVLLVLAGTYAVLVGGAWALWGIAAWPVAIGLLLVALVIVQLNLNRLHQQREAQQLRSLQALHALHTLLPLRAPMPALSGWAASPELVLTLSEIIRLRHPRRVVELGSGASTVVMAYALERNGTGRVHALDHSEEYAAITRRMLASHNLTAHAAVHHAPLRSPGLDAHDGPWYDRSVLEEQVLRGEAPIDLLVIDGPPRESSEQARYPALPVLMEHLSAEAVIVLDDAQRPAEQAALKRWLATYPDLELEWHASPKGMAVLYRSA